MTSFTDAQSRSHKGRKTLIVLFGIAIVPLIYAGALVWANQDPTGRLDHIAAAVVNLDEGATSPEAAGDDSAGDDASGTGTGTKSDGDEVDLGQTLTDELVDADDGKNFSWTELSAEDAQQRLDNGDVLAVLTIPQEFSANAVSVGSDDPLAAKVAKLTITTNDGANMIVGNIGLTVGTAVADTLSSEVSDNYLQNIYAGFTTIHGSVTDAADGATQLSDGADEAAEGSGQLMIGLGDLRDGASALANGSASLADGAGTLSSGANELAAGISSASAGAQQLQAGAGDAQTGAQQLADGLVELDAKTTDLPAQAQQLSDGATSLANGASTLDAGLGGLATGAQSVEDGAGALASGADTALSGAQGLQSGASQLAGSTPQLAAGANDVSNGLAALVANYDAMTDEEREAQLAQLASAASAVSDGATTVDAGAADLDAGATTLVGSAADGTGLAALQTGAHDVADGATQVSDGADSAQSGAKSLVDGAGKLGDVAGALSSGAGELTGAISTAADGSASLASGIDQLAAGSTDLATGLGTAETGANELASGSAALASSATTLSDGASALSDGTVDAANGAQSLDDGLGDLASGSSELEDGLASGLDDIPSYTENEQHELADVASSPVELDTQRLNEVPGYGVGLAPYFMALALWVGGMSFYMMMPALNERVIRGGRPASVAALRSYLPGAAMGVVQSLLMVVIVHFAVGVEVANLPGLFLMAFFASITFLAINQAFIAIFGSPGRFGALLLVVVQLASAGGTYPIETSPAFFQALHGFLPLTYVVEAFRSLTAGGTIGIAEAIAALSTWLVIAIAATTFAVWSARRASVGAALDPASAVPAAA
ncbi:MAG: YhgE/Pip family protein [Pseudoclavibacter sp.]